ncbi:hydroxymethylglutaryl-CoA reductase, degradative [Conexibacter stalactiti]|uniref:3-hydroxy-3-methylglutaryl coenzyme A reductase n=1 Tax=Conexibacter stalactiti TaxID=1940611 RepID=A0ABU4HVV5_9ACTN|nr:hydroxymethylglutaryl-CoA reductase, degradative [Conexibacter stalactiti]MDW5597462.1 hydroxymethylglutaryl-CoA reductase, degradative [Conexibacter stalactiti]MEC5038104.1 hydroxymethylglutaryl-CoA reductase, degradative [Conexibacter stalactiti]
MSVNSRLPGFYKLALDERFAALAEASGADPAALEDLRAERDAILPIADGMVENAVGLMPVPLGIGANFRVNGRDHLVPMASEEPSVIAAASNLAQVARERGGFFCSTTAPLMIAQVQVLDVADPHAAKLRLHEHRDELLAAADEQDPVLVRLGGGARELEVRVIDGPRGTHVVVHLVVDVGDAMGANAVNTMAEALAPRIAEIARGRVLLRILSNKADRRLARARAVFAADKLGGPQVVDGIVEAYQLAADDPYRAATHNKGIMNGISAVVLATGNDTRAVEAGCHSHAVRDGRYTTLSHMERDADGDLVATLEVPMPVGLVGGATKTHPTARAAVRLLAVETAAELAQIVVAVGLAQNVGALRALATEGIQRGHMTLHARNVAIAAGAAPGEVDAVVRRLVAGGAVRADRAEAALSELRAGAPA